jgi:hypothetical protein
MLGASVIFMNYLIRQKQPGRSNTITTLDATAVAELPELFQLKCLSPALEARPHLNGNNPSIPQIWSDMATDRIKYHNLTRW